MKGIIIVIALVIISVLAIGIYVVSSTTNIFTEPITNPPAQSSGGWGQELTVEYADGSRKVIPLETSPMAAQVLGWAYGNQAITWIEYSIYSCVKTDDSAVTTIDYQGTEAQHITVTITTTGKSWSLPLQQKSNCPMPVLQQTSPPTEPTQGQYTKIYSVSINTRNNNNFPTVPGAYTFTFTPSGGLQYKTNIMTNWENIAGPITPIALQLTLSNTLSFYWNPGGSAD